MTIINFQELRSTLESSKPIIDRFREEGPFTITTGVFAEKIAPAFGLAKEAEALVKAIGPNYEIFEAIKRRHHDGSTTPTLLSFKVNSTTVDTDEEEIAEAVLTSTNGRRIPCEFVQSRIGNGGFSEVKVGSVTCRVPVVISDELYNDLISAREEEMPVPEFEVVKGAPALFIDSPFDGSRIPAVALVGQRDIPAWSDEVPQQTPLTVVEVLEPSRKYGSQRITVSTPEGTLIVGLIPSSSMLKAITGIDRGGIVGPEHVGRIFEITEVLDRTRKDGTKVENENGTVQKKVLARDLTNPVEFSF